MCTLKTEKEENKDAWGGVLGLCRRGGRQQREAEQDERRRSPAAQRQSLEEPSARGPRGRAIIGGAPRKPASAPAMPLQLLEPGTCSGIPAAPNRTPLPPHSVRPLACLQYTVAHSKPSKHFPSAAIVSRSVV